MRVHQNLMLAALLLCASPATSAGLWADALHATDHHPFLSVVGAGLAVGAYEELQEHHCHTVVPAKPGTPSLWVCDGVQGDHPLAQEAKDLTIARSNTAKLERALEAAGEARPKGCAAHHIVPQNEGREWAKDFAEKARNILKECGIDLNAAENGVWLPAKPGAECTGKWHPKLHTKKYYKRIFDLLDTANKTDGCQGVKNALKQLKLNLSAE